MNVTFTADDVVAQVKALAAERPHYVYPGADYPRGCSYVDDVAGSHQGQGCLIGQALQRLGVPRDWLREHADEDDGLRASAVLRALGVPGRTGYASSFLDAAQTRQDHGEPWGRCVARAARVAEEK